VGQREERNLLRDRRTYKSGERVKKGECNLNEVYKRVSRLGKKGGRIKTPDLYQRKRGGARKKPIAGEKVPRDKHQSRRGTRERKKSKDLVLPERPPWEGRG